MGTPPQIKMAEISDELLEELKDCFDIFDKTGAETCASADLCGMLQSVGLNPITADMAKVIKDSELEGKQIDFPTFVSIYEQFKKRPTIAAYADLMEAFKTYDREGNGQISGAQLRNMMTINGRRHHRPAVQRPAVSIRGQRGRRQVRAHGQSRHGRINIRLTSID